MTREELADKFLDQNGGIMAPEVRKKVKEALLNGDKVYVTMPKNHGRTALSQMFNDILEVTDNE